MTDPDGNPRSITWQWERGDSATGPFTAISGATMSSYTLVAEDVGKYMRATASYTDDHGAGKTARFVPAQVMASNSEPTFTEGATATRSVPENSAAGTNIGSAVSATDSDSGDTLTYSLGGEAAAAFNINSSTGQIQTKTGVTYNFEADANTYIVVVSVRYSKDAAGDADTATDDTITVTINLTNVNEAPVITNTAATETFPENGTRTVERFIATDVDASSSATWSVEPGDDGGKFNISAIGELTFKTPPNFEMPTDAFPSPETEGDNVYVVTVKVSDGSLSDTHTISVTVTNVNDAPVITSPPTTANFPENETRTVTTFAATDQDTSSTQNTLTWSVEPADDGPKFLITRDADGDGELTFSSAPNFEMPTDTGDTAMNNTYVVTVKVSDGSLSDTHEIIVRVTNVNEAPTIDSGSAAFSVDENTAATTLVQTYEASDVDASTTLTWSLEGEDAGDFTFTKNADGDGELKFRNVPDFEMPADDDDADMVDPDNDYQVTVKVTDNGSPSMNATRDVTVTVNDLNERPVVSGDAAHSFMEIEFDVLDAALDEPDFEIGSYTAYDDDGDDVAWSVSGDDAVRFYINPRTGVLSFSSRPDFEMPADRGSNNEYNIFVNADDGQGETNSVGTFTVTVTVTNVDETPEITGGPAAPRFAEIEYDADTSGASVVVQLGTYTARDEEGEVITWDLGGDDAADFRIANSHGHLVFRLRPNFEMPVDADTDNVYEIIVRATDATPNPNIREYPVTVTVTDVNERPDITGDAAFSYVEVPYDNTDPLPALRTYTAEDYDDGDTFNWSLAGVDAAHLEIGSATGVLTFRQGNDPLPDYENPLDGTADGSSNTYNVIVNATDNHGKATSFPVVVTVTNVNERPELTAPVAAAVTYDENTTIDVATYTARDEEGGVTWSLTGTDSGDFAIDSSSGAVTFNDPPDFEAPVDSGGDNVYEFTVIATDVQSGVSRLTATVDVTVTVADVEEAGAITLDTPDLAVGDTVTFTLSDPDGGIVLTNLQWIVETRTPGGSWGNSVESRTGEITFPFETDEDDTGLEIRTRIANYTDRRGSGKTAASEGTNAVTADPIINAAPRFIGSTSRTIAEDETGNVGEPFTVSDRDGDTLTFGLGTGGNSGLFGINASTGQLSIAEPLDFETAPNAPVRFYTVTVTLHDGEDENGVDEDPPVIDVQTIVSVYVLDVEEPGVVTLPGGEPEIGVRLQATLGDPDGGVSGAAWQWARSADGETGWTNISGATSSGYTPGDADASAYLRATVMYEDRRGPGKEASALTGDLVPGENRRPTFPDTEDGQRTIAENTRANRNIGTPFAATDPEGDRLTYSLTGTDAGAFTIVTSSGQLRTRDALDFETQSSYSVAVEVHDGRDGAGAASTTVDDTQSVIITIENLDEPGTVTLTTDTATISARVPVTAQLSDPDNVDAVDWQWYGSPNGSTGWVAIQGAASATYTPSDDDEGRYIRATASYTDGQGPNKTTHGVSPRRVDEPPPVNSAPAFPSTEDGRREAPEDAGAGDPIGDPVAATDLNAGDSTVNDPLTYSLTGSDAASFTIDAGTGQLRLAQDVTLDYEGKRSYRFTLQVTDGRDQNGDDDNDVIDATKNVTVTVTNVNEAPVVTGNATPSFDENGSSAVATYTARDPERDRATWSVSGTDFIITDRGRLHFASPPSYEGGETYRVTVTATDDVDVPLAGSLDVTVTVTDLEEDGTVTIAPPRGWVDTRFRANLTDDDRGQRDITWKWERSTNRSRWMEITGATSSFYTAGADDVNSYLRATASYSDRRGSNKTAEAMTAKPIVALADKPATNAAPEFASDTLALSVVEGATAGRNIRSVTATDAERDVLTYSLAGTDAGAFDIDAATGQLRTKAFIDREIGATYTLTVSVHDGFDAAYNPSITSDDTIEVTITVTAPSPPPRPVTPVPVTDPGTGTTTTGGGGGGGTVSGQARTFTASATRSIAGGSPPGANVGLRVAARNPSNASLTYSLGGPHLASFTIVPTTGQIRVGSGTNLDYQSGKTTYIVQVTARSVFGSGTTTVTIKVTSAVLGNLGTKYDTNGNELIDRSEVIAAVNDYFLNTISREEVTGIIILYFSSLAPAAGEQTGNEGNAS